MNCGVDYDFLDANFEPPGGPFSPTPPGGWPTAAKAAAGIKALKTRTRRPKTPKGQPAPEPGMPPVVLAPKPVARPVAASAPIAATAAGAPIAGAPAGTTTIAQPVASLDALPAAMTGAAVAGAAVAATPADAAPAPAAAEPMADLRAAAAPVDDPRIGTRKPGFFGRITASRYFLPRGVAPVALGLILGAGVVAAASTTSIPSEIEAFARTILPSPAPSQVAVLPAASEVPVATPSPVDSAGPLPEMQPGPNAVPATVTRVFDGNTILVNLDGQEARVRYLDVVVPDDSTPDGAAAAVEAARLNEEIVGGHQVLLETDVTDRDSSGRLVRHVWVEEDGRYLLVGTWLVLSGVAQASIVEPDVAYRDLYSIAEDYARQLAIGIWGTEVAELPETGPSAAPTSSPIPTPSAAPTLTPQPTPVMSYRTYTSTKPLVVTVDPPTGLEGALGRYVWRDVSFYSATTSVRWSVTSLRWTGCTVTWHVAPDGDTPTVVEVPIAGEGVAKGTRAVDTTSPHGTVAVESTCPSWSLRLQGVAP